jgi:ATP-dependent Clp protease ATP-binding subunit ClpC
MTNWRILELSLAALMAGTQYRGALEKKLKSLLEDLQKERDVALFIDEIHLIMGAGSTDNGAMDVANLLKPALARGELRCIGATTIEEYRRFIEKDPALERRFQIIRIEELTSEATLEVLQRLRPSMESHHGVKLSTKALKAAVGLTERYMTDRRLPDKAIDVVDQACARYRLKLCAARAGYKAKSADDSLASPPVADRISPHDIRKIVSRSTGIPIDEITSDERKRLDDLEKHLKSRIIGQDEAVKRVVRVVKRSRVGLSDPNRPDASMLFLGPTGVGKTQLAEAAADLLFGSSRHLITFDMSEYPEAHSISRLIGAPPGYVGSEEEGALIEAVRTTPFSILLFDEIEKAHPRIFDIFLPILDEGRLTGRNGRQVSFKNTLVVFTSNIGADLLRTSPTEDERRSLVEELSRHFRPEFINRIDEIVPFQPLLMEDVRAILHLFLADFARRLRKKGYKLRVYQGAYEVLAEEGYSREFGARELRRTVERLVIDPISEQLLRDAFKPGHAIEVILDGKELAFRQGAPVSGKEHD